MKSKITKDDFLDIGKVIAENSGGKIRIAFNEEDDSMQKNVEAAHFLKVKEKRLGRDLELYAFMAEISPEQAPADFIDVVIAIKNDYPESYQKASVLLKKLGEKVYEGKILEEWNTLFPL